MDRILFIDDRQITSARGVERRIHPARKFEGNPVVTSDRDWEGQETTLGSVFKEGDGYRMWYQSYATTPDSGGIDAFIRSLHLYAESEDGLAWTKPELGINEDSLGSRANNIALVRLAFRRDLNPSVLHTPGDGPAYRMFTYGVGYDLPYDGHYVAYSDDGLHWSDGPGTPVIPGYGDEGWFTYDEVDEVFRGLLTYGRWEAELFSTQSTDGLEWTLPRPGFRLDQADTEWTGAQAADKIFLRAMPIAYYGPVLLGFLQVLRGVVSGGGFDGEMDVHLLSSTDGRSWSRVGDSWPILQRGDAGAWDDGLVWTGNSLVEDGDEVVLYYNGCRRTAGALQRSKWPKSIGRASWPRDRLVGLMASGDGVVETIAMVAGGSLHVNADASKGEVSVQLLDANGSAIEGFSAADGESLARDTLDHTLVWSGDTASLPGREVRVQLTLHDAELFALWWEQ